MATVKISALGNLSSMTDTSVMPVTSVGTTYKLSGSTLTSYLLNKISVTSAAATGSGSLAFDSGTGVLTFTPPALSNYLTGITSSQVTTALGYTPLQSSSLSVTTNAASGGGSLSYSGGVFTFTPPSLSSYLTSVNWASPGTIGSTTSNTGAFTTLSATTTGTSGALNVTYNPASASGAAIQVTGKDSNGGVGYFDFFKATNTTSGATNPNKYLRLSSTGAFEIVNSAYSLTLFSLTNAGNLSLAGDIDSGGSTVNVFNSPTTLNIANGTGSGTVNLGSGVTTSGNTIAVNLGANGASGSTTNIVLGSSTSGATSTTTVYGSMTVKDVRDTVYALTYASTLTPDAANGDVQTVTLTGNVTLSAFSNPVSGQTISLIITQDSTGGRTLTSTMKFAGGFKTLSTAANAVDILHISYFGTTYYASLVTGYA